MKIIVTGGAGFIGSHLVNKLINEGHSVSVIDNNPVYKNKNPKAEYITSNIVHMNTYEEQAYFKDVNVVFHLAADPMVNTSATNPKASFDTNVIGTFNVLEACRKNDVPHILFTSSSVVYGEAKVLPTPEDYPLEPISNYGASKLSGEGYISSYAHSYGIKGSIFRLANIFGERSTHGVMYDFYNKLLKDPNTLEVLGDGKQEKSYLHVSDCVDALITVWKRQDENKIVDYFNVGSSEKTTVNELAKFMFEDMSLNPGIKYTGGKRGWVGDVPVMLLDTTKIQRLGWKPKIQFREGMQRYISWLKKKTK